MENSKFPAFPVAKNWLNSEGKAMSLAMLSGFCFVLALFAMLVNFSAGDLSRVSADTATTTVTVLNTPPNWSIDAFESVESSSSSPTNVGNLVRFGGQGIDDNGQPYYLLICTSTSTPTARSNQHPLCNPSSTLVAVSSSTASGVTATGTHVTLDSEPEENRWYGWICDSDAVSPACNTSFRDGLTHSLASGTPYVVNHRPTFSTSTDSSPADPNAVVTWTTSSSDADVYGVADQVRLFVCKQNDFTGTACGVAGSWCSSATTTAHASCTSTIPTPFPDGVTTSFAFIIDTHDFAASGGRQGVDTVLDVNNVAPTISSSTISLIDAVSSTAPLTLTVPQGETQRFKVRYTVTDNNSCMALGGGREISTTTIFVYRSGIGQAGCTGTSTYNPNNCYPGTVPTSTWNTASSSQDSGTCSGFSDATADWTTEFPLWYIADPTDGNNATDTQFFSENWRASVVAQDDDNVTSTKTETATGTELLSFLAYDVTQTSINYGSLTPGQQNDPIVETTTIFATGNVGLDQTLYGDHMCTTYPSPGCVASSTTSTIPTTEQRYATSSVAYATATPLQTSSSEAELEINVPKTTSTSSPASRNTIWGIRIPASITLAGDYKGQNTLIGKTGEAQNW